jgi:rubrerythrin
MLSARTLFEEIRRDDDAYRLFLSVAAKGEAQGGWENERLAALTADPVLAAKIARHGADEEKHARLFSALLKKRGLEPVPVPEELDYIVLLTRARVGVPHERLRGDEPAGELEIMQYLAHGRVTEQRGAEEIELQVRVFAADRELGRAVRMVAADEVKHLSHCHEELLALCARGHGESVRRMLRDYARAEIRIYRDVCLAMTARLAALLGWPRWKHALIRAGIRANYGLERLWTWRRMVKLRPPLIPNALGEPAGTSGREPEPA